MQASDRLLSLVALSFLCLLPRAARADEPAGDGGAPDRGAYVDAMEEARARFDRGVELHAAQEFDRALIEFERAYTLVPNFHVLYNIAQVNARLRRYARAVATFERYLAEGGTNIPPARVEEVQRELAAARARTAKLLVRVDQPGAEITLDGQHFATSPMQREELVDSGEHPVTVTKTGFRAATRTVILASGDVKTEDLALEPVPLPTTEQPPLESQNRAPMWIAWGTTATLAAGTALFGLLAVNASSDLDRLKQTRGTSERERDDAASKTQSFAIATDVFGAATIVAAGVAIYLTLRTAEHARSGPRAVVGTSGSSIVIRGTF